MSVSPQPDQEKKNRTVRTIILVTGTLFIIAMAYGSGMRGQVKKMQGMNEERKVVERDLRFAHGDLRLRLAVARQLEARRLLHLALLELDKRNFGIAQEHLKAASGLLKESAAAAAGSADEKELIVPDTGDAATRLEGVTLVAGEDFGPQRTQLLTIANQIDVVLTPYMAQFFQSAGTSDDALKTQMRAKGILKPTMNDVPQIPGNDVTRTQ